MAGQMIVREGTSRQTKVLSAFIMIIISGILIQYLMMTTETALIDWGVSSAGFVAIMILCGVSMISTGLLIKSVKRRGSI